MKLTFRRWLSILLLAFLMSSFVCGTACAATIPEHTSNFYVNDFAGVFTDEQVKVMMEKAVTLCEEHDGAQVVITTVQSLDGETVENYANQMYNKYKIGKESMGVLVLMSVNDRKIRVEVGRNMQVYIPDSKAGKLMNTYAIPKLKQNMFAEGLMDLQDALVTEIKANLSGKIVEDGQAENESNIPVLWIIVGLGIFLIVLKLLECYIEEKERSRRYSSYSGWSSSNSSNIWYSSDSSSSSSSSNSSNNDSNIFSDDSSSFSGFDGCSDGGGASGDF